MAAEIVDDDDVAGSERRHQHLFDIGQEAFAVDRSVDHARRFDAIVAQGGQEGQCPPATVRDLGDQPLAAPRAAVGSRHVGLGPGLVDEDQARWIKPSLVFFPLAPPPGDVGPILLAGVQAFF